MTETAKKIRDGGARYVATSFSISAERSLMTTGRAVILLRLQPGSCPSGEDAIVAVIAWVVYGRGENVLRKGFLPKIIDMSEIGI